MSAFGGTEFLVLQVGLAIFLSMLLGAVFRKLKQSAIIGYILGGIILGPQLLGIVSENQAMQLFSELGILILMFYIGLELDLKKLKEAGFTPFVLGPAKMVVCFGLGYFGAILFGFSSLEAVLIGLIISMSSTAIIGKYLLDNGLTKSREAGISIPMLLVEDFIAIVALAMLSAVGAQHSEVNQIVLNSVFFVIVCIFVIANYSKYFIKLMERFSYEKHIALYAFGLALVLAFVAKFFGLSPAIGAFFGGFLLSELRHSERIRHELETFRDFFMAFFFVAIGLAFTFPASLGELFSIVLIGLAILAIYIIGEIVVYGVVGKFMGLDLNFSIRLANIMIPIGEFSLLIAGIALILNVPRAHDILNIGIFLTAASVFVTPYFINASHFISNLFRRAIPERVSQPASAVHSHFSGVSIKIFEGGFFEGQLAQKELFDGLRRIGINLFAIFASVYLTLIAQLQFEQPIIAGFPNALIFSIIGAVIVLPVFFNILREITVIVRKVVSISAPKLFPQLSLNQLRKMSKSISDVFIGFFFFLLFIVSIVVSNFLDVIYSQIPLVLLAFAAFFIAKGTISSYRQSKTRTLTRADSKTILELVK